MHISIHLLDALSTSSKSKIRAIDLYFDIMSETKKLYPDLETQLSIPPITVSPASSEDQQAPKMSRSKAIFRSAINNIECKIKSRDVDDESLKKYAKNILETILPTLYKTLNEGQINKHVDNMINKAYVHVAEAQSSTQSAKPINDSNEGSDSDTNRSGFHP